MSGVSEKLAPGRRMIDLGDGVVAKIRVAKLKRVRAFQEMVAGLEDESASLATSMRILRWGLVGCDGLFDEDGSVVPFATTDDPELGVIATDSVVDALTVEQTVRLVHAICGENFVSPTTRKN